MVGTGCVVAKFFLHPMYKCIAVPRCISWRMNVSSLLVGADSAVSDRECDWREGDAAEREHPR
jgi:hypothetical protein